MEIIRELRTCQIHFNPTAALEVAAARRFFHGLLRLNSRLLREPDFIALIEHYLMFLQFCKELRGAEPLRDIECSVSGGLILMYSLNRPMSHFSLPEAECALCLNLFKNKDNISLYQIHNGIDTASVYPVEAYLITERTKKNTSLAPLYARIIYDM